TAGLRDLLGQNDRLDTVEQIGIERAKETVEAADIRLCVVSLENLRSGVLDDKIIGLLTSETAIFLNKLDLAQPEDLERGRELFKSHRRWTGSVVGEDGMRALIDGLTGMLKEKFESVPTDEEPLITHSRHRTHLESALQYLEASLSYEPGDLVFAAEELRYASQELGKVTGEIGTEDILDVLFSKFCIGK
ncbi:mitochondrial splicing system protein, partial [Ceratobasidium sp. 428]